MSRTRSVLYKVFVGFEKDQQYTISEISRITIRRGVVVGSLVGLAASLVLSPACALATGFTVIVVTTLVGFCALD